MDLKEALQDVLKFPNTAAFSRIRYVRNLMSEEEQQQFLNGLYLTAIEARESGSPDMLWDYLEEWETRGVALNGAQLSDPIMEEVPWAALQVPVKQAKFALVTTGGFYVDGQEPYETDGPEGLGDWSYREIRRDTPREAIRVAHAHYDLSGPREDVNCVFPLDRFEELEREGVIGRLAEVNYSFMGFIRPWERLAEETAPEVARHLKEDGVEAVFISST